MPVNMNAGRAMLVSMIRERMDANQAGTLIAFGAGEPWWGKQQAEVITLGEDGSAALKYPVFGGTPVTVSLADGSQDFVETDFVIDPSGGIARTEASNIAPDAMLSVSYEAAIPAPTLHETALVDEVGRGRMTNIDYVLPSAENENPDARHLPVGNQSYAFSDVPTRMLLIRCRLAAGDAVGKAITEVGLFSGCEVAADLPPGQLFYTPDQIATPGMLLMADRVRPLARDGMSSLDVTFILEI